MSNNVALFLEHFDGIALALILRLFFKRRKRGRNKKGKITVRAYWNFMILHPRVSKKPLSILISLRDGVKIVTFPVAVTEHQMQYLSW